MKKMPEPMPNAAAEMPSAAFMVSAAKPTFTRSRNAKKYSTPRNGIRRHATLRSAELPMLLSAG